MMRQIFGLAVVGVGVMALLQTGGQFNFGLSLWPAILTLVGYSIVVKALRRWPPSWFGLAVGLYVGNIGLLDILYAAGISLYDHSVITDQTWPILLVAIGISIAFGPSRAFIHWGRNSKRNYRMVGDMRYGQSPWRLDKDLAMEHGVGDLKVDLSTAEITEGHHHITVKGAIGDILVRVPDNVNVTVQAKAGIGELVVLDDHRSGLSLTLSKEQLVLESNIHLHIDAALGIGNLRVIASPAAQNRLVL